ncbi:uncharacterized protein LOC136081239 [Hydra vulgaris]|uniref:Uncharacterized protein LOC136081239 n=1 Tax=Hydra vulgaris TaxID=6087 RepID=A0ABM4BZC7_HYDVU
MSVPHSAFRETNSIIKAKAIANCESTEKEAGSGRQFRYLWLKEFTWLSNNKIIKKIKHFQCSKTDMQNAFNAVKSSSLSQRLAAIQYNFPRATLEKFLRGDSVIGVRPGPPPKLPNYIEKNLVNTRETITVIAAVNAAGKTIPPYLIPKGKTIKSLQTFNTSDAPVGSKCSVSETGSTKQGIAYLWFTNTFLPNIGTNRPQVLIVDDHNSHNSVELLSVAIDNNIEIVEMPAHCSHWLQPLDRTKAWDQALTAANIISGFQSCGIFPYNPSAIPYEAFLPNSLYSDQLLGNENLLKSRFDSFKNDTINYESGISLNKTFKKQNAISNVSFDLLLIEAAETVPLSIETDIYSVSIPNTSVDCSSPISIKTSSLKTMQAKLNNLKKKEEKVEAAKLKKLKQLEAKEKRLRLQQYGEIKKQSKQ